MKGDGKLDLVAGSTPADQGYPPVLLLGNGNGTFRSPIGHSIQGFLGQAVVLGDFNNDGRMISSPQRLGIFRVYLPWLPSIPDTLSCPPKILAHPAHSRTLLSLTPAKPL